MCGRYSISPQMMRRIETALGASFPAIGSDSNVTPAMFLPVVRAAADGYELVAMKWGLLPHWSKEPNARYSTFNARVETAAEKPAFRDSWKRRRSVIPAEAFYEWKEEDGVKIPWRIAPADGGGLAFAGLWDRWNGSGETVDTFTILVGPPNDLVARIHDRMPAIIFEDAIRKWLDPATDPHELPALLSPCPSETLTLERLERGALNAK